MNESYRAASFGLRGLVVLALGAWAVGCEGALTADQRDVALEDSPLGGSAGAPSAPTCHAIDTADTTCDHLDDDCDGTFDENCDFAPASCPTGYRRIVGTAGDDTLVGTTGRDCILGYGGDDTIYGLSGDDLLVGGPGDDTIQAGSGDDKIRGGDGADEIDGDTGTDTIEGGDGNDRIDAGSGNDVVQGGMCHDQIAGGLGVDDLRGNDGSDRIVSARVFNRVDGGNGTDACGGTSCEVSLLTPQCISDLQCGAGKRCVKATGICVAAASVAFTDPTCNGVDDDCDGDVDEEFVGTASTCGVGACVRNGTSVCDDGEVVSSCTPGTPAANDASCNNVDEDCNGQKDEDFVGSATSCGVGACRRNGTTSCVAGSVQNSCMAGAPASDANCNGVDDDCDGRTDEHYVAQSVSCGVGSCSATGTTSCVGGSVHSSCTPGTPGGSDASCDGVDQDCSGQNDEDYVSQPVSCGIGACAATGGTSCVGGSVQSSCTPGTPTGNDSTCDGVDDDCDGHTDENYASQPLSCGIGACAATGSTSCVGGSVQSNCTPGTPAANDASCDGVDQDCNGQNDEDYASQPTSCGKGACAATGSTSCVGGTVHDSCTAGTGAPDDATCDGVDDDCSGQIDEDYASSMTTCGIGACASMGATSCVGGVEQNSCSPGTGSPSDFTCDGVDDDCNGQNDEDYSPHATTCGIGSCGAGGATSCVGGVEQDSCVPGSPAGNDPTCDGFDDDCDGQLDEDYAPHATSCGTGACADTGATSCVGGSVQDSCSPGTPAANDASCNGSDDDCNGATDEDFQPSCVGTVRQTCAGGQVQMFECADGDACNGVEACSPGGCVPGTPVNTSDGDPCTADDCDPADGSVTHTPVPVGTSCSDGLVCNGEELCLSGSAPGCATTPSGGVAWWRGENNADDSIDSNDGALVGTTFSSGEVGQAFSFDGNDSVDLTAHAADLNLTGTATLEFWMRSNSDVCRTIFGLRQDSTHEQFLQLGNGCNGTLINEILTWRYVNGAVSSTVGFVTATRTVLLDNNWHHVALTLDGTNTRIYVDGISRTVTVATGTNHGDWGAFPAPTSATMGARNTGVLSSFFLGGMDEVTLYDRALSPAEVSAVFMAGAAGKCGGGPLTCTDGANPPAGTMCEAGGVCDGAGNCN